MAKTDWKAEAKALKKIRHPSRIRELAGFTDAA